MNNFKEITRNSNNSISINKDLLFSLYKIQSPSHKESGMRKFLINFIKKNIPNAEIITDHVGNLLITVNSSNPEYYPCVVAHMDEVFEFNTDKSIISHNNFVYGWDNREGDRTGIGADDKNGIYVALEMLKIFPNIKAYFSVGEEIGLVGSSKVDLSFFDNVGYMLQCDRRGHKDFISITNGVQVCSDDFIYEIFDLLDEYNYTEGIGTCTDIGELKIRGALPSACNISCGYYDEHTEQELVYLPALENCLNLVYNIINNLGCNNFPHTSIVKRYSYKANSYYNNHYNYYDDYFQDAIYEDEKKNINPNEKKDPCQNCKDNCYDCKYPF